MISIEHILTASVLLHMEASGLSLNAQVPTVGVQSPIKLRAKRMSDTAHVHILADFESLGEKQFIRESGLFVRVLAVARESGSAHGEGDEVVHDLYLIVSDYGEVREQRVYRIGPVFAPHLESLVVENRVPVAYVDYGVRSQRHRIRILLTLDGATVTSTQKWP
jgi:hypothetical protein